MILDTITHYDGIDWLASSFSMGMIYFLGNKNRIGIYFGLSANLSWLIFAILASSPPIFISNGIFLILNIRGTQKWKMEVSQKTSLAGAVS